MRIWSQNIAQIKDSVAQFEYCKDSCTNSYCIWNLKSPLPHKMENMRCIEEKEAKAQWHVPQNKFFATCVKCGTPYIEEKQTVKQIQQWVDV